MILLIDTNVILDIVLRREPFFNDSYLAILNTEENADLTLLSASAMTDLYYILRKAMGPEPAKEALEDLQSLITYADVLQEDISEAFRSPITDLEDALVAAVARRYKADYIVSRNKDDFANAKVPVISPAEFNQMVGITT